MRIMKSAALVLPALLLAGCSLADVKTAVLPVENTATIETAPTAAPQTLTVYASDALAPAARAYAEAQGVTLTMTADAAAANLLLTDHAPGGSLLDVTSDTLLAAAAGATSAVSSMRVGTCFCFCVRSAMCSPVWTKPADGPFRHPAGQAARPGCRSHRST